MIKCIHKECPDKGEKLVCYGNGDRECEGYETTEPVPDPKWVKRKLNPGKYPEDYIQRNLKEGNIPSRFLSAKKEDFPNFKFVHPPISLYLCGSTGSGKTRLMAAIAREMVMYRRRRPEFEFISPAKLLYQLRQAYSSKYEIVESELIDLYSKVDCLFLDDFGTEKITDWSLQTQSMIINSRYEEELITIISSNLKLDKLVDQVGDRIVSRISEMCKIVNLKGKDRRI